VDFETYFENKLKNAPPVYAFYYRRNLASFGRKRPSALSEVARGLNL